MRNAFAAVVIGLVGVFGLAVVHAGEKPPETFIKAMKNINIAVADLSKANLSGDFPAVKKSAITMRENLNIVVEFWDTKKTAVATTFAKDAIKSVFDLEAAAALESAEGVTYSMKEIQTNCNACHTAYREAKPDGTFEIKTGN